MKQKKYFAFTAVLILTFSFSCTKFNIRVAKKTIPANASVGVIIDSPNNLKNYVMAKFLEKGYPVKAINAADLYTYENVYDIKDYKTLSYHAKRNVQTGDKADSVYKLNIYNYEINKAEMLNEIKNKWNVQYLVLFDMNNFQVESWVRVIELGSYEIIWIENYYPTGDIKKLIPIVDYFIAGITAK